MARHWCLTCIYWSEHRVHRVSVNVCDEQIAHFKIPHYISFVNEYPLTIAGKVKKFKMREMAVKMYGLAASN